MISLTWQDATGGRLLLTGSQVRVLRGVQGLDALPTANSWQERVSFDGSALMSNRKPVRSLVLPLAVIGSNPQLLVRDVLARFQRGGQLEATVEGSTRILFECEFEGAADVRSADSVGPMFRKLAVNLTAGDPWWYGPTQQIDLAFAAETPFDEAAVDFDDAGTPLDGGDSTLFTVSSDIDVFPEFVVTGPFTDLSVSNSLTGAAWQIAQPVPAGQVLVVDARPGRRGPRMQGAARPDWSLVTSPSRLFTLRPGSNTIAVGAAGDDPDSNVQLRYRARFATP
jgi:hypothetical protein